jgi:DNA-binding IclR family transcriptional regulator
VQALELVKSRPGITIPEMATAMGIKQNYLYRVLPTLQKDRKVVKRGRGWHPAGGS